MPTGIEDFAAQLRELKERSGRSYGMLATRLHVSTSTLHRYCNGVAVPGDYAPVERFARACGATPEELLTLHRRWLLADAERRREPSRAAQAAETAAAADAEPVQPPQPEPTEVTAAVSAEPQPQPRPRPRRTKIVLAAGAAIAVLLPLAIHTAHNGSHDTPVSASRPGSSTASAAASAPASPSASAPASSSAAPASSSPSASAQQNAESAPPPFQVSVLSDNWDSQCGQWFLLNQPPGKVPPPPSLQQTNAWAAALGGIPAGDLRLQLTAQGVPGQPVVLHTLYVRIVSSSPAPKRIGYTPASGCGAGLDPASFAINLDAAVPRAKAVAGLVGDGLTATIANFPFQISATDTQVLDVDAHTTDQDVSWYLDLVWSSGNRQGTLRIDDHGKPFRTAGLKGAPAYFYDGTTWSPTSPPT
ncbi:plasmid maintenance system antidote protein VapI [Streptacidiphilus sp. MAP12-20]|uniref:helix-turn-helix domain-containing protein n=1 Tax=Streptacidiphilus sp. MAP12-20 TaxID=3156299 RepID=UPI003517B302